MFLPLWDSDRYACMSLLAYVVIAVLPKVHVNWYLVVHDLVIPHLSLKPEYVLTVVGFRSVCLHVVACVCSHCGVAQGPRELVFGCPRPGNPAFKLEAGVCSYRCGIPGHDHLSLSFLLAGRGADRGRYSRWLHR